MSDDIKIAQYNQMTLEIIYDEVLRLARIYGADQETLEQISQYQREVEINFQWEQSPCLLEAGLPQKYARTTFEDLHKVALYELKQQKEEGPLQKIVNICSEVLIYYDRYAASSWL